MATLGGSSFKLQYEISPIYLTGGSAGGLAGGTLPLLALTEGASFSSLLSGASGGLDQFFAHFVPIPGASLIQQKVGTYPFANQATAANAVIRDPINISLLMICPAQGPGDYARKQAVMSALKATLDQHNNNGGTYSVNTPSFLFTDCLLTRLVALPDGESKQVQSHWQWDFVKPLISLADAAAAQNNLMGKISQGSAVTPDASGSIPWSSTSNTIGNPGSGAAGPVVSSNLPDSGLSYGGFNTLRSGDSATTIPSGSGFGSSNTTGLTIDPELNPGIGAEFMIPF